jgi:hypothetical protein
MIKSFEVIPQNSSTINPAVSTYQNTDYGIQIQYAAWSEQESKSSGELIDVATFVSPTGPNSDPTVEVSIYLNKFIIRLLL